MWAEEVGGLARRISDGDWGRETCFPAAYYYLPTSTKSKYLYKVLGIIGT